MEFEVVSPPDETVRQAAVARHARLTKPGGALGRLETLGAWLAACQGECPPHAFRRTRVVVFAGDHGVAANGVSAYPPEVTAQMVANFQAGGAAINVLAGLAGATVRVVDLSVAEDSSVAEHKVRRSSGAIDVADALTEDEVTAALAAGRAIADEEVDAGADLLVAGDMGIGNTTPAAVLVAALTGVEPVAVVGRGTGIDDRTWMRKTAAIRDALRRAKPVTADPVALLRTTAGADLTAMAAFLAQAAARRTPVVLDGVVSGAAALLAEELAPGASAWWVAGHRSTEPAHSLVLEQLDLDPLLELNMRLGEGSGAAAALPLLSMAIGVLSDMATFADAGVTDATAVDAPDTDAAVDAEAETATEESRADPEATAEPGATAPAPAPEAENPQAQPEATAEPRATAEPAATTPDPAPEKPQAQPEATTEPKATAPEAETENPQAQPETTTKSKTTAEPAATTPDPAPEKPQAQPNATAAAPAPEAGAEPTAGAEATGAPEVAGNEAAPPSGER